MDKSTAAKMIKAIEAEIARIKAEQALAKLKAGLALAKLKAGMDIALLKEEGIG